MAPYIEFRDVSKVYRQGETKATALKEVSLIVEQGEFCAIVGPSGAGKTTILNILGGIDRRSSGTVTVDGEEITRYNERRLASYRRNSVGFVFQFYNLIPNLTALENVELAAEVCKRPASPRAMLDAVELSHRMNSFPSQLSGGEQQRVAIARALVKNPKLLLCDEPTGALDEATGIQILSLLQKTSEDSGMTVVLITHNNDITELAQKVITVRNGQIDSLVKNLSPRKAEDLAT
ncbi:MAG: ABC transporter ATP-binding protein [Coriobacteriales bacterium]|jgi:putative ABC transport system ATP-binding protein|nr:ABC transporter ATP-binding protein [Coriobacteriales bacterium]